MRIIAVVLMLSGLVLNNVQAQETDPPPYLYYYSPLLGGLIIERADGTDSRQIAADVIPAGMSGLLGAGWSPSGEYFAAYRIDHAPYRSETGEPFLINRQGESIFRYLGAISYPAMMQWSPTGEDILLIVSDTSLGIFFWLIDAEQGILLADFAARLENLDYNLSEITWDVANQQIVFSISSFLYEANSHYRVTLHFDGSTVREPVDDDEFQSMAETVGFQEFDFLWEGYATSPSGRYDIKNLFPAVLTDSVTGEAVELPRHAQSTVCRDYRWSIDEQYLITMSGTARAGGGCGAALLGVTNRKADMWREIGSCSWASPPCVGWLPESVDVSDLPSGSPEPVQLDHSSIVYDEDKAVYGLPRETPLRLHCGEDNTATITDLEGETTLYRLTNISCPYIMSERSEGEGVEVMAAYDPTHDLLATYTGCRADVGVTVWMRQDDHYEPALKLNTDGFHLEFRDDNQMLYARNANGWKVYAVADILYAVQSGR